MSKDSLAKYYQKKQKKRLRRKLVRGIKIILKNEKPKKTTRS